jgi:peptide/nickel transport system substrate-binding protein
MIPSRRRITGITVLAIAAVTALASCGGGGVKGGTAAPTPKPSLGGAFGSIPQPAGGTQHAGTITWAEPPSAAPTWILPVTTAAAQSVNDTTQFGYLMWRPLYWYSNGVAATETPAMSLATAPQWSNNDTTVSFSIKPQYKWSDGQPVTAQDFLFTLDVIKAAVKADPGNWGNYSQGQGIPDQISSAVATGPESITLTLNAAVNPSWFATSQLPNLNLMPSHAWAKASANGPMLDWTKPGNALKIYNFLAAQSKDLKSYPTNPLWKTVDGPYTLSAFQPSTGAFTLTPNPAYGGPHVANMSTIQAVPFTSETAEFNAIRSGGVDIGFIPLSQLKQVPLVRSAGYNVFGYPTLGFGYITYNFSDTTGDFNHIIAQLYVRQAFAHLEDEKGYLKAFFGGAGGESYGPVPALPPTQFTPDNALTNPYPFSLSAAVSLLKSHGWTVAPGGTDTCTSPGTGPTQCGAGIPAGTALAFNLYYDATNTLITNMVTAWASEANQAGVHVELKSSNYNYIITYYDNPVPTGKSYINKWAMEDFGGFTDATYPTQLNVFDTPGSLNEGSYSSAMADQLIHGSISSSDPNAVKKEASFLTQDQPGLFQPNADTVVAWKTTLSGTQASFANQTQYYLTPEFWYLTK